jgi:outer membrane protein assembly factor BamB
MTDGMVEGLKLKNIDAKGNETILNTPIPGWNWSTGGPVLTRPLPAEQFVAFGGGDHKVFVCMADERTQLYRISTGGPIGEGLAGHGTRTLLIPSGDFNLYAADLLTAQMLWTFPSGAPIQQEPLVADQDVYVINTAGNLSSLDPVRGTPRWTIPTQGGPMVSISGSKIYLRSYNNDLFAVDRATGRMVIDPSASHLRAGLNLREYDQDITNRFNDRLYFATSSGMILCLREVGQPQPRPLKDPKAPPFGYVPPEGLKQTPPTPPSATGVEPGAQPTAEPVPPGAEPVGAEKPGAPQ